ncbi:MAG TPA: adenylate/guanylate cyclase domain-containing protein [Candidatus Ozemobacteraceae bacterium]|nr:adenylate/guanylate cyclase domain-containing protein [Candidatus Ozemobacteraceae bacterium]
MLPDNTAKKLRLIDCLLDKKASELPSTGVLGRELLGSFAGLEDAAIQKRLLSSLIEKYVLLERRVDQLLKNTLPESVAEEIKSSGIYPPRPFDVTILFMDCAGFTKLTEKIPAEMLISFLHELFSGIDLKIEACGGTKVKTIGDAYMAVFGAPEAQPDHAVHAVNAALDALEFIESFNRKMPEPFHLRIGIHSGMVMGGVVGRDRMQFDVFGDNVNIASRFESSGEKSRINVSESTWRLSQEWFTWEERGEIPLKNKAPMRAFFVTGRSKNRSIRRLERGGVHAYED